MATLAFYGASFVDGGVISGGSYNLYLDGAIASFAGDYFTTFYDHGTGGETVSDMKTRLAAVIADSPTHVLFTPGPNDMDSTQETPVDDWFADVMDICTGLRQAGIVVYLCTPAPRDYLMDTAAYDRWRSYISRLLAQPYGPEGLANRLIRLDNTAYTVNGENVNPIMANDPSATPHPNVLGCYTLAQPILNAIWSDLSPDEHTLLSGAESLLLGNDGTVSGAQGTLPDGWLYDGSGSSVNAETGLVNLGDRYGIRVGLANAVGASGADVLYGPDISATTGDVMEAVFRFEVLEEMRGVCSVAPFIWDGTSAVVNGWSARTTTDDEGMITGSFTTMIRSPRYTATVTGAHKVGVIIQYRNGGQASGAFALSSPQLRKYT